MVRREDEAIVLDAEVAGEADRRVALLLRSGESIRALAPSAARSRQRFGAALQPGGVIRARWTVRAEGAIAVLDEATLLASPPTPDPLERFYVTAHVLELAGTFSHEGAEDPRLFRLTAAVLARLAAGDDAERLARYFEAWTLRLAGLLPELDVCAGCGASLRPGPTGPAGPAGPAGPVPPALAAVKIAADRGAYCAGHGPAGARHFGGAAAAWLEATRHAPPEAIPEMLPAAAYDLARALPGLIGDFTERPLRALAALIKLHRA